MGDVITKLEIITRKTKFQELKDALNEIGVMGMTVTQVLGCGTQKGEMQYYRGVPMELKLLCALRRPAGLQLRHCRPWPRGQHPRQRHPYPSHPAPAEL